jgi:hypothetical protein
MSELDQPLTHASEALDVSVKQLLVVVAMFVGGVAGAVEHATWGRSLAIAAGLVLLGFAFVAWTRVQTCRDRALELILEGKEDVPLRIVQRQRRRLASARTRSSLARTLESMIDETLRRGPLALRSARPLLSRSLIRAVQGELRGIARLLEREDATVRGTALIERIVTRGESSLYGQDPAALRSDLARARALLGGT